MRLGRDMTEMQKHGVRNLGQGWEIFVLPHLSTLFIVFIHLPSPIRLEYAATEPMNMYTNAGGMANGT